MPNYTVATKQHGAGYQVHFRAGNYRLFYPTLSQAKRAEMLLADYARKGRDAYGGMRVAQYIESGAVGVGWKKSPASNHYAFGGITPTVADLGSTVRIAGGETIHETRVQPASHSGGVPAAGMVGGGLVGLVVFLGIGWGLVRLYRRS